MSGLQDVGAASGVRDLQESDLEAVIRMDALQAGLSKPELRRAGIRDFLRSGRPGTRVGLVADSPVGVAGYLLGEVRAFEFGSEVCGWVFGVAVDPDHARQGTASALLAECCGRFRESGVTCVRTMVLRNDVPLLSFFRANGFVAGSFAQLELDLEERS